MARSSREHRGGHRRAPRPSSPPRAAGGIRRARSSRSAPRSRRSARRPRTGGELTAWSPTRTTARARSTATRASRSTRSTPRARGSARGASDRGSTRLRPAAPGGDVDRARLVDEFIEHRVGAQPRAGRWDGARRGRAPLCEGPLRARAGNGALSEVREELDGLRPAARDSAELRRRRSSSRCIPPASAGAALRASRDHSARPPLRQLLLVPDRPAPARRLRRDPRRVRAPRRRGGRRCAASSCRRRRSPRRSASACAGAARRPAARSSSRSRSTPSCRGAVARVGDLVFDGSLRTQLAQLRAQLTRER